MVKIPLGNSDWRRSVASEPLIKTKNRYYEQNPTNQIEGSSMLARPGLKYWKSIGTGPIRGMYSQPGSFNDAMFIVSGSVLYRVDTDGTVTILKSGLATLNGSGFVSMAATAAIGTTPEFLYIADGQYLYLYVQSGYSTGDLYVSGVIAAADTVQIDTVYYAFTAGSVDAGAPAGSLANPWLVAVGVDNRTSLSNLLAAINASGTRGTTYSTGLLTAHGTVSGRSSNATDLFVTARTAGSVGNNILVNTTIPTGTWGGSTLSGGGSDYTATIDIPNGLPAVSVSFISGYVIVVPGSVTGYKGRFYWILPGVTTIDPLNFATAERSPDPLYSVRVVGDQFWLFGTNTTEVWYPTGDSTSPFQRVQGQVFNRGIIQGTDVQIRDQVILVDTDGVVYSIQGGSITSLSDNSVSERIRTAIKKQV